MTAELIDLHVHTLPALDDGPASLEEALVLVATLADQGVSTVVATAHANDGRYNATRDQVLRSTEALATAAAARGLSVTVLPSMELLLDYDALLAVKAGAVLPMGASRCLMVELPHGEFPHYTERALYELMLAGYQPVLNHPERNRALQHQPDKFLRLAQQGVLAAVTAGSLLGRFGPDAQRCGEQFLRHGAATLLVSDAHDTERRPPELPEGLQVAAQFGKTDQRAEAQVLGLGVR